MGSNPVDKKLYVGNLDPRLTDHQLHQLFSSNGEVVSVKIIYPELKNNGNFHGLNYGFVEFRERMAAEAALVNMNGKKVLSTEIRVNWAHAGSANKEDVSSHFHIFIGDLSPEVNDQLLAKAFSIFPSMSEARVMWDPVSGKSRGYGFAAFREKADAEKAITSMNGEWLGSRPIRVNWANQKQPAEGVNASGPLSFETIVAQSSQFNTTIYIGNLPPTTSQQDLIPLFQQFGYIVEVRLQVEKGYAFVKLDTHEHAALAIFSLNGKTVNGRTIKCHWGKDRTDQNQPPIPPVQQPQQNGQYPTYPYQMPTYGYYPGMAMPPQFAPQPPPNVTDGRNVMEEGAGPKAAGGMVYTPQQQQPPQQWPYYFQPNQPQ